MSRCRVATYNLSSDGKSREEFKMDLRLHAVLQSEDD